MVIIYLENIGFCRTFVTPFLGYFSGPTCVSGEYAAMQR
jgi:hypothetical protein